MTSASRMFFRDLMMPAFSRESSAPAGFRIPAVSTRQNGFPSLRMMVSVLSRVVPGTSLVRSRSSPHRRLMMDDLPTLMRPTIATRRGSCRVLLGRRREEGGDPLPELVDIDLVLGRDGNDVLVPEPVEFGEVVLAARGVHLVDHDEDGAAELLQADIELLLRRAPGPSSRRGRRRRRPPSGRPPRPCPGPSRTAARRASRTSRRCPRARRRGRRTGAGRRRSPASCRGGCGRGPSSCR